MANVHSQDPFFDDSQRLLSGDSDSELTAATARPLVRILRRHVCLLTSNSVLVFAVLVLAAAPIMLPREFRIGLLDSVGLVAALDSGNNSKKHNDIVNVQTGLCLDWGAIIVNVLGCNPKRAMQQWAYDTEEHRIKSIAGRCLDGGGKFVHVWDCSSPTPQSQQWIYEESTKQISYFINTDVLCLGANKTSITLQLCDVGNRQQHWEFQDTMKSTAESAQTISFSPTAPRTSISDTIQTTKKTTTAATAAGLSVAVTEGVSTSGLHVEPPAITTETSASDETANTVEIVQVRHFPGICLVSGEDVHMDTCNDLSRKQLWMHDFSTGQLKDANGSCLDAGSPDLLKKCRGSDPNQAWGINEDTGHIQTERGFCLDAWWPNKNGSAVTLRACERANMNQQWNLKRMTSAKA